MSKKPRTNVPDVIPVMGRPIKILWTSEGENYGETDGREGTIKLSTQYMHCIESTLLHEIMHVALRTSGLAEILGESQEEAIVTCLEHALIGLYERKPV